MTVTGLVLAAVYYIDFTLLTRDVAHSAGVIQEADVRIELGQTILTVRIFLTYVLPRIF